MTTKALCICNWWHLHGESCQVLCVSSGTYWSSAKIPIKASAVLGLTLLEQSMNTAVVNTPCNVDTKTHTAKKILLQCALQQLQAFMAPLTSRRSSGLRNACGTHWPEV